MKNIVCIISGPTASGKTSTSLELCSRLGNAEIVNFDSLLFYKELNIGTAKPNQEELNACKHHLVDIRSAKDPINAADYARIALPVVQDIHSRGKAAILTGGSGFYLQALLYGMFDSETVPVDTRDRSNKMYTEQGIEPFIAILKEHDPESHSLYHENDHYRIRRAVEHWWTKGTKFSLEREQMLKNREENSNFNRLGWNVFHIYLNPPKEQHFEIIQQRTGDMLEQGLIQEVSELLKNGFTGKEKPLQSIGYKETLQYLNSELDKEQLYERINISTRQLAKAQRTWFKKVDKNEYNPLEDQQRIVDDLENFLKQN
ncbi:MAG: tRNA (adenosine(37)-N6)-dimethylallyltransferase MiaA [Bacteriovoracaceae bacterium]|nr:tRNA (adenosine(37)-N6)-dimethylallyltransferase MiaA [Bacteriovoracaceae bacterium]